MAIENHKEREDYMNWVKNTYGSPIVFPDFVKEWTIQGKPNK